MNDCMTFPNTVEEFMEQYKIVDTEQIYTNGAEMVPIFRMNQWFEHEPERKKGEWQTAYLDHEVMGIRPKVLYCSACQQCIAYPTNYCPNCGSYNGGEE